MLVAAFARGDVLARDQTRGFPFSGFSVSHEGGSTGVASLRAMSCSISGPFFRLMKGDQWGNSERDPRSH